MLYCCFTVCVFYSGHLGCTSQNNKVWWFKCDSWSWKPHKIPLGRIKQETLQLKESLAWVRIVLWILPHAGWISSGSEPSLGRGLWTNDTQDWAQQAFAPQHQQVTTEQKPQCWGRKVGYRQQRRHSVHWPGWAVLAVVGLWFIYEERVA